ncbi:MAG: DUF1566 domain-containing protein [Rhodocyclaceae bacterium]|nr:DUF1566 domain-containing protein [Rhodocyclaceae bacterium]
MTPSSGRGFTAGLIVAALAVPIVAAAQSCTEQFIPNSTAQDFEDNGDATVTDRRSGLTWARCSVGQVWRGGVCAELALQLDWDEATVTVEKVNAGGELFFADWRLPNLRELASISEVNCRDPRINVAVFPQTATGFYWSASRKLVDGPELAAFALSYGAEGMRISRPTERHHVRLVRRADHVPRAEAPASASP